MEYISFSRLFSNGINPLSYRYLRGSSEYIAQALSGTVDVRKLADSDYVTDTKDLKYLSGYLKNIGSATCGWVTRRQLPLVDQETISVISVLRAAVRDVSNTVPMFSDIYSTTKWATLEISHFGRDKLI